MKWYIASRQKEKANVKKLIKLLRRYNHQVDYDWTLFGDLKPYNKNEEKYSETTQKISSAILDSEVFVLLSDSGGTDMFIELGMAIANNIKNKTPRIYIIGEHNKRSLMHFHPCIKRLDSIDDIFSTECPEISFRT